jgi:2-amino-4-hydroxy-6-hydroxymethyldihydropteridine diphosphokinase
VTRIGGTVDELQMPVWSVVTSKRREHIQRVVSLLEQWSGDMKLAADEAMAWRDVGAWHDALRDADEATLRNITGDDARPEGLLHGFAAAIRLEQDGERRDDVLQAIRWHTIGNPQWNRLGRALYMADFLEPGRKFMQADRAFLAELVPTRFDEVFRQVVRLRLEWALREGKGFAPETVALWDSVR